MRGLVPRSRPDANTAIGPTDVLVGALLRTATAFEDWLIPYWVMRADTYRFRVVVPPSARLTALRALATWGEGMRYEVFIADLLASRGRMPDLPGDPNASRAGWVCAYTDQDIGSRSWRHGARYGVDIEFWLLDGPILRGPQQTSPGPALHVNAPTAELAIGDRTYPSFEPSRRQLPGDIA